MSATNVLETALLALIFQNANSGLNIGDATGLRGSTTAGVLYMSLHTADPGEAGSQNTSESAYTNYARVSKQRDATRWAVAGNVAQNSEVIAFPACGVTGSSVTNFGIGSSLSAAGDLYFKGASTLSVSNGITPQFAINALQVSLD